MWQALPARRGVLVRVRDERGFAGVGEASPLPVEAVREADEWLAARDALQRWRASAVREVRDPDEAFAAAEEACGACGACGAAAAARFAVETALCDLLAARRGVTFAEVLAEAPAAAVPLNAVCDATDLEAALAAKARGIRTLKLKLEAAPAPGATTRRADDAELVGAMQRALGDDLALRGDANRTWPQEEAMARLAQLRRLQYVEEPCRDFWTLLEGAQRADQPPLALDESAVGASDEQVESWMKHPQIGALILKPTRLGLATSLRWARAAARAGRWAVVTHALEGPVAMAACAELARAIGGAQPDLAVGLDDHAGLAAWPVRPPQIFEREVRAAASAGLGLAAQWEQLIPRRDA